MIDWIGWFATAVFALSYFSKNQVALRRIQASAAVLWIVYGVSVSAAPVVVANAVVATMALVSARRDPKGGRAAVGRLGRLALAAREKRGGHS